MNSIKKDLLAEIDRKIQRKKDAAARAIERNTINAFVQVYMDNVEEIRGMSFDDMSAWWTLEWAASDALLGQIQSFDNNASVQIIWQDKETPNPKVNGVLIKWSQEHQKKWGVEPELFVDILSMLFSD